MVVDVQVCDDDAVHIVIFQTDLLQRSSFPFAPIDRLRSIV